MPLLCVLLITIVQGSRFSSLSNFLVSSAVYTLDHYPSAAEHACLKRGPSSSGVMSKSLMEVQTGQLPEA